MRVLFLPNFQVEKLDKDDPSVPSPNKVLKGDGYWFFRHVPNIEVHVLDNRAPFPLRKISRQSKVEIFQALRALLIQGKYDLVISHSFNSGFVFAFLRRILGLRHPPHIVVDVGCLNGGREHRGQIALISFALKSVAGLVYHSRVNKDFYDKHFPWIETTFVFFGVDTDSFSPPKIMPDGDYAISVGVGKRDYHTLMRAWESIAFPLKIVGPDNMEIVRMKDVQVLPRVPIDQLIQMIIDAKLVVLPLEETRYSVGQMTLIQSMALQKPIVVSGISGIKDYLTDGVTCVVCRPGDPEDLREKVKLLLENRALAEVISKNARTDAISRFTEKEMAQNIGLFAARLVERSASTMDSPPRNPG